VIEYPKNLTDYRLLDSGNREKLETFSGYTVIRPDPRAFWTPNSPSEWDNADAKYIRTDAEHGTWKMKRPPPNPWYFTYGNLRFFLHPTDFKHVGIFPEQAVNWDWLTRTIAGSPLKVLNLFGYTGAATVVATSAGAFVTHVDSSKPSIVWAKKNYAVNSLPAHGVRWIEDDAYKFVVREKKRGNTYDGVIMDPPRFGRGAKGEVWKLTDDLPKLLVAVKEILSSRTSFVLINVYTADISAVALYNLASSLLQGGSISVGELALKESDSGRLLPNGLFLRRQ